MNYIETNSIIKSYFRGSRRLSNVFWATVLNVGSFGFFVVGLDSFFDINSLVVPNSREISFIPQGIVLLFYGTVGSLLGIFISLTIYWNVGSGYNEYSKATKKVKIYRKGFPVKDRELTLTFSFEDIKSIKMRIKEGLNPKRQLLLGLSDGREIPLTGLEEPKALNMIEDEAIKLAKHLNVFLEID